MKPMTVFNAYRLNERGELIREYLDLSRTGDHGSDPIGNGMFRMVPSGDIVNAEERKRRLNDAR